MPSKQQKKQLKKWVIENFIAIENKTLDEKKTMLFLDLIEKNKEDTFIQECFTEFQQSKKC